MPSEAETRGYPDPELFDRDPIHSCPYCFDARRQALVGCLRHTDATPIHDSGPTEDEIVSDLTDIRKDLS